MSERDRLTAAWQGRIAGCQLGKPVELLSMRRGLAALHAYLDGVGARPLRDYVPHDGTDDVFRASCKDEMTRSEPDDDINYTVLALRMLERFGADLSVVDVARTWLLQLPLAMTFTAERAAYRTLVAEASEYFAHGAAVGFDIAECSDNPYNDWIGAQIRADLYGWVLPGNPTEAARLAGIDASLSHRGVGVHGAQFVAACGAAIPAADSLDDAVGRARRELPDGAATAAIDAGRRLAGRDDAVETLHGEYRDLSPVHTLNNLAVVVWALLSHPDDFGAAIGDAVEAGWDTDCNGATVGGLWGCTGRPIPERWVEPWNNSIAVTLADEGVLSVEDLVDRTLAVAQRFGS